MEAGTAIHHCAELGQNQTLQGY